MGINLKNLNEDGIEINFNNSTLQIIGSIDSNKPGEFLNPYFIELHNEIIKTGLKEIIVDVTKLTFLNSSGIKEFVEWIMRIDSLPQGQKYRITFLTHPDLLWQESSISTLVYLNPSLLKKIIVK